MKRTLILTAIGILLTTGVASAAVKITLDYRLPDGNSQRIYSEVLDKSGQIINKFIDGGITCYTATLKTTNFVSISCVK